MKKPSAPHSGESDAAAATRADLAHLRQHVQAWIDSDRVLPADGSALLATLDRAREKLAGEDGPAAQAGFTAFIRQVQALIAAGLLEIGTDLPLIEARSAGCRALPGPGEG
jgi:hypothetical protein